MRAKGLRHRAVDREEPGRDEPEGASPARSVTEASAAPIRRRRVVWQLIRESAVPLGVTDIAARLDVHPNTVRFHLEGLLASGQIERVPTASAGPGRPALRFRARPGMDRGGPRNYQLLAAIGASQLAAGPEPRTKAMEAGRAWGGYLIERPAPSVTIEEDRAVGQLVGLLDDLGFAPELASGKDRQIGLRHCPFLELVETQAEVVCALHLGLMRGAMDTLGARTTVELEPFAAPDLCLAHLNSPSETHGSATARPSTRERKAR